MSSSDKGALFHRLASVTQAPIHDEDCDVAAERKRVLKGNGKYDVLCLENLTKVRPVLCRCVCCLYLTHVHQLSDSNRCKRSPIRQVAKTTLQDTVKGGRRQGRQRKRLEDNIREWTGLEFAKSQRAVENRGKMKKTGCKIICGAPLTVAVKG